MDRLVLRYKPRENRLAVVLEDLVRAINALLGEFDDHIENHPEGGGGGGATTFTGLTDTPASYSGQGGKAVKVKATADGLEFGDAGGGTFLSLTDTPSAFTDKANYAPRVNSGETALEFIALQDERIRFHHADDDPPESGDGQNGDVWLEY